MNSQGYQTLKDLGIHEDTELLKEGKRIFGSPEGFEERLNKDVVPITNFASPKELILKKGILRRTLKTTIELLITIASKLDKTQGTGRKELLLVLKDMTPAVPDQKPIN